jgi:hypothetical protein
MFYHIYAKKWENTGVHKAFIKCASENCTVNVKFMETIKITCLSPYASTIASLHVKVFVQQAHNDISF